MLELNVKDVIGTEFAVAAEEGFRLREEIQSIDGNDVSALDFGELIRVKSLFFNVSLCALWGIMGDQTYREKFRIINASDTVKIIYARAMELMKQKMESPGEYAAAVEREVSGE